jgi:hypothetical protein
MDRKNWLYEYDHHPPKERSRAGANKNCVLSFVIRFELFFSFRFILDVRWASLPSLYHSTWEIIYLCFGYGTGLHTSDRSCSIPLEKKSEIGGGERMLFANTVKNQQFDLITLNNPRSEYH